MEITLNIKDKIYLFLEKKAKTENISVQEKITSILENQVDGPTKKTNKNSIFRLGINPASSNITDASIKHDKYLYGNL